MPLLEDLLLREFPPIVPALQAMQYGVEETLSKIQEVHSVVGGLWFCCDSGTQGPPKRHSIKRETVPCKLDHVYVVLGNQTVMNCVYQCKEMEVKKSILVGPMVIVKQEARQIVVLY